MAHYYYLEMASPTLWQMAYVKAFLLGVLLRSPVAGRNFELKRSTKKKKGEKTYHVRNVFHSYQSTPLRYACRKILLYFC
jgi:hypothetical protein